MATRTWNATTNTDFETDSNWGAGGHAHAGDTIIIASATAPTTTRPAAGAFSFIVTSDLVIIELGDYIDCEGGAATIGDVLVISAGADVSCDYPVGGALVVTSGVYRHNNIGGIAGTLDVGPTGLLEFESQATVTLAATVAGTLVVPAATTITFAAGLVLNGGTLGCVAAGSDVTVEGAAGITGTGTVILNATSVCGGRINMTSCTWTVTAGARWVIGTAGAQSLGGSAANLDLEFNLAANTFSLSDAIVRDVTVTDGTPTLTNLTCRTLTLAAAKTLNLGGFVRLGASPVFGAAAAVHLTNAAIIPTASITFDAVALGACDHTTCCMFDNGAAVLIVKNLPAQTTPIQAYSCAATADGGGNAANSIVFHAHPSAVPTGAQP